MQTRLDSGRTCKPMRRRNASDNKETRVEESHYLSELKVLFPVADLTLRDVVLEVSTEDQGKFTHIK